MIRYAPAIVVVVLLSPSVVAAQATELTIGVAAASVHKSPSNASPVIGHASRGARLDVTREVGDWVKVAWPAAPDGVGYVRVSMGSLARQSASPASTQRGVVPARAAVPTAGQSSASLAAEAASTTNQLPQRAAAPSGPSHLFGVGARLGGATFGVGASARAWSRGRFGMQFDISRSEVSSPVDLGSVSSTQFGPSALYAFDDFVADYTWLRPYAGAGIRFYRSTMTGPLVGVDISDSSMGYQAFGGGELSFASVPQFSVSAELSYHWLEAPFAGYELGGLGLGVAGHWYLK